jgi:hypothetical protein
VLPALEPEVIRKRWNDESREVDVVDRVRLARREIRPVAVRAHARQHDEMAIQREAMGGLEGSHDASVEHVTPLSRVTRMDPDG